MTGRDFLDLANSLVAGPTEAAWRSAVSRAYYAAFHVARALLENCGFTVPRGEQAHAYLGLRLSNAGHPDVSIAGKSLHVIRSRRNAADYDLHHPFGHAGAKVQVESARDVIMVLEAAGQDPVKTQITDAMKVYERDVLKQVTWHP